MQDDKDPFHNTSGDTDRTVFTPAPGGRRRGGAAAGPAPATPWPGTEVPVAQAPPGTAPARALTGGVGRNPLLRAAADLFALVRQLSEVRRHPDVADLRRQVIQSIKSFEASARAQGASPEAALTARYAMCGLIDETVLSMPWGLESVWSRESMLITFHREYSAGERFFALLKKGLEQPHSNIDVLEFLYVCLSLGFQGRYRLLPRGGEELARVKQGVYQVIRNERGEPEGELSPRWRGLTDRRPAVSHVVPLWVLPVAAAAIVLATYAMLSIWLNEASDRVYAKLSALPPAVALPPPAPTVPPAPRQDDVVARLRANLTEPIADGLVRVDDLGNAARIVLFNKGLFPSGGAEVGPAFRPLFVAIGTVVRDEPGPFVITGHTDSVPIRTVRFPSNWHLSKARAEAVAAMLSGSVGDSQKLRIEARADAEPIAGNDTAEGRELNRRVEIRIPVRTPLQP